MWITKYLFASVGFPLGMNTAPTAPLPKRTLTVRFEEDMFEELIKEAEKKGIGPSALTHMAILEHLQARRRAS